MAAKDIDADIDDVLHEKSSVEPEPKPEKPVLGKPAPELGEMIRSKFLASVTGKPIEGEKEKVTEKAGDKDKPKPKPKPPIRVTVGDEEEEPPPEEKPEPPPKKPEPKRKPASPPDDSERDERIASAAAAAATKAVSTVKGQRKV